MKTQAVMAWLIAAVAAGQGQAGLFAADRLSMVAAPGGTVQVRGPLGDWQAQTQLDGCKPDGAAEVKSTAEAIRVLRRLKGPAGQACSIVETFAPTPTSVRWEIQVQSEGDFWTTPIVARVKTPSPATTRFWTAWLSDAKDALLPRPPAKASWRYGRCNGPGGMVIPIATLLAGDHDAGVSWAISPESTILEARLSTTADGDMAFSFEQHRLGKGRQVRLAMDLTPHEADWRGGLRWMVGRYPDYFDPPNPKVQEMAGCGCYSGADKDVDYPKLKKMGFRLRWEAAFDWPQMGIFLPPVGDRQTWTSNNTYRASYQASFKLMNDRARLMHAYGVWHLSYFNCSEFSAHIKLSPVDYALPEKDLWKDPTSFAVRKLSDSMWRDPQGRPSCVGGDNALVMDPASPGWRAQLIEQARRHLEKVPDSDGLAIDRIWWSYPTGTNLQRVNFGADDGIGWYEGRPGRHFSISVRSIMDDLGAVMHAGGKVIFYNPFTTYRLDCYRHVDGFFDEDWSQPGEPGYARVADGLLALRKPAIIWTGSAEAVQKDADFFQRHLLLGVYPMVPFPANDHSIGPNPAVDAAYLDYAPLLLAMRGKKWVLEPHCIEVAEAKAQANLFEVPGGWVAPVVFGPKEATVKVLIRNAAGIGDGLKIDALHPGVEQPQPVTAVREGGVLELQVPLRRGCAMVRLAKSGETRTPGSTFKKIVLIAGKKSHGPGVHEYEKDVKWLKHCLDTSPNAKGLKTESCFDGWPPSSQTLDDADTIALLSDGLDRQYPVEQHPFLKGDHLRVIERQVRRGCGLVLIHWPLWVPGQIGREKFMPWLGGFCDYQNPPGPGMSDKVDWSKQAGHPICRGLKPFTFQDEYYGNVRFLGDDSRFTPILPFPGKPRQPIWAWAWQRDDGGRSFAFIGGHTHKNWQIADLRKAILNAILWTAHAEIPAEGVESSLPSE